MAFGGGTSFGGFGTTPASSASGFGFGSTNTAATGFSGFGASTTAATKPAGFGFGTPAAAPTSQPSAFGGFGATAPATGGAFGTTGGFGAAANKPPAFGAAGTGFGTTGTTGFGTTGGFAGFGTSTAPSTSTAFGGFGTTGGASAFGAPSGGLFGGAKSTAAPMFGGGTTAFGGGATTTFGGGQFGGMQQPAGGLFGQPQQQQLQQQQPTNPIEQLYHAVLHCSVFGDERDNILARWNMLQASWGIGKAFFSVSAAAIELNPDNPFCRFKAIGYSALPQSKNEDGVIGCFMKKKLAEVEPLKQQLITQIHTQVFGSRQNVKVNIDGLKALGADQTEILLYIQESSPTGQTRRIPASEAFAFVSQPTQAQQLKNMGIEMVVPKVSFTSDQVKEYLDTPPQGVDPRLWKQAQLDNPDPKNLIPVPMIGFKALQQRIKSQESQAKTFQGRLDSIAGEVENLQKRHQETLAKMMEAKRRHLELGHRVLHVMVKQEATRKSGFTIQPEEEKLRIQLETLQAELSAPTQFKGRLNELLSQIRLQSQVSALSGMEKYTMDPYLQGDIKNVLRQQQEGIQALVAMLKEDMHDLQVMEEHLAKESNI